MTPFNPEQAPDVDLGNLFGRSDLFSNATRKDAPHEARVVEKRPLAVTTERDTAVGIVSYGHSSKAVISANGEPIGELHNIVIKDRS